MSFSVGSALFAYFVTTVCSLVVAKRSVNWRIRLLALTVGLLPLCQMVVLVARQHIWMVQEVAPIAEDLELLICALCLTSVHLLSRENADRKNTDSKLRVTEATPSFLASPGSGYKRAVEPSNH